MTSVDTTQVYMAVSTDLKSMEAVRDLSWSTPIEFVYQASEAAGFQGKAHTGFEPVPPP